MTSAIRIYRDGVLTLVCQSRDWPRFLPNVFEITWVGYALDERWTWEWAH